MRKWKGLLLVGILAGTLTFLNSCTQRLSIDDYTGTGPEFDLQEYFNGPIKAWGLVQDRKGRVTRRFDVVMNGSWDGDTGTLEEDFDYYDGETQKRVWTIKKIGDKSFVGSASDIIGQATGQLEGSAMRWAYVMDLPVGDTSYKITFDDWMFQMNDGILINRSYLKKFGITMAELTLFMQKQ